MGSCNRKSRW